MDRTGSVPPLFENRVKTAGAAARFSAGASMERTPYRTFPLLS